MRNGSGNVALLHVLALVSFRLSLVTALFAKPWNSRKTCTDAELAEYALLVAVGPAESPMCEPASGQMLFAQDLETPALGGLVTVSSEVQLDEPGKKETYFTHLHVVQSDSTWCALPCLGPSWELNAPKPEKGSPYVLLEAAIWRQFRKVTLYQFDAAWEKLARNSYHGLCNGTSWGCEAYTKHREAQALVTVGPWPEALDVDGPGLSAYLKAAFQKVFSKLQEVGGNDNSRQGMTYSGHGGDADGSLFAGAIDPVDSIPLLESSIKTGGKFAIFNFGTNCQEGRWKMLAAMQPFADHILASDLNVGGLKSDTSAATDAKFMEAKAKLADVAVLKRTLEARKPIAAVVTEIIKRRREFWLGPEKDVIAQQKLRQGISAFVSAQFPAFAASLKTAYQKLPVKHQEGVKTAAEASECDVLTVVRYMDTAQSDMDTAWSFLQHDARNKPGALEKQFLNFRPEYASTQTLFSWIPVTNGLGFNFKGAWYRKPHPRCDLETAFGTLGCGPICEQKAKDAKAEEKADAIKEKKQDAIFEREWKKVFKKQLENEARHNGTMSAEEKAREEKKDKEAVKESR